MGRVCWCGYISTKCRFCLPILHKLEWVHGRRATWILGWLASICYISKDSAGKMKIAQKLASERYDIFDAGRKKADALAADMKDIEELEAKSLTQDGA